MPTTLDADLVVDALGRGSSVSDWLVAAGWPAPPVQTLDAKVTYTSRWYELPGPEDRPDSWWWQHIVVMPTQHKGDHPAEHDFLVNFFPMEGNRAIACMGSWGIDMPRTTEDFVASAERVRAPLFAEAMAACEPISDVHLTRSTGNKWRRYDRLPTAPDVVFIGDSICAFNPFYGQGMSSAARCRRACCGPSRGRPPRWTRASSSDSSPPSARSCSWPGGWRWRATRATSAPPAPRPLASWRRKVVSAAMTWPVFNLITGAAREDPVIDEHFAKVFNLDESLGDMMRSPRVLFGLLRYKINSDAGTPQAAFRLRRAARSSRQGLDSGRNPHTRASARSGTA